MNLKPLQHLDSLHLKSDEGWLELWNYTEANEELELIGPEWRVHPDVLVAGSIPPTTGWF